MGFTLGTLGSWVAILARELDVAESRVAVLSSAFGAALVAMAVVGRHVVRIGTRRILQAGFSLMALGSIGLGLASTLTVALASGLVLGSGAAAVLLSIPMLAQGADSLRHLSRANAASSVASVSAPVLVGAVDAVTSSGRSVLLVLGPVLLALAALPQPDLRFDTPGDAGSVSESDPGARRLRLWRAAAVTFAVAVEFCFLVWATTRLVDTGLEAGPASILGAAFMVGMAVGRFVGPSLVVDPTRIVRTATVAITVATAGVVVFPWAVAIAPALLLAGLGVAMIYPNALDQLIRVPGSSPSSTAVLSILASGLAILSAPVVLGALADQVQTRWAFVVVGPLLAVHYGLTVTTPDRVTARRRRRSRQPTS